MKREKPSAPPAQARAPLRAIYPRPTSAGRVSKEDVEGESSWILFILYIRFRDFAIAFAVSPQQIFDYVRGVRHGLFSSLSEI